jgi:multidrug resistance efflux pump
VTLVIVVLAAAALLAIAHAWGWLQMHGEETTENAYVRGRTTVIAPQVSGYVVAVAGRDYQQVRAGDVLARIDDRVYIARVDQARAGLQAAEHDLANNAQAHASSEAAVRSAGAAVQSAAAQLTRSRGDMVRVTSLVDDGSVSVRERDQAVALLAQNDAQLTQARAATDQARQGVLTVETTRGRLQAAVAGAKAQLAAAQIDMDHTIIRAPETGQLGEITVRLGQYVTNGTQLMALVPPERWVIANFKEAQTVHMAIGQAVGITVDALDGAALQGHIEQISPAAASEFSLLKPDNATGNFVKVPQRIGIRIGVDAPQAVAARLRPGMSVVARIVTQP